MKGNVAVANGERDVWVRSLMERLPDAVFEFDLQGRFVAGNRALEALTGYSCDELRGSGLRPLVRPEDLARVTAEFERAAAGTPRTFETVAIRKDGARVTVSVTNVPIVVAEEIVGVYGIARDVSEQRAVSAALEASEAQMRGFFDGAGTGISMTTPAGSYLRANAAYCAMLGYTEAELLGLDVGQILHPEDRAINATGVDELLAGERDMFVAEKRCLTKDGGEIWVRSSVSLVRGPSGEPMHLVANVENISERKSAEADLARSESLQRIAGSVARVGGWSYELARDEVFWSDEIRTVTGVQPDHSPTVSELFEQFPVNARERVIAAATACLSAGTPFDLELEYVTFDGRDIWTRFVGQAERDYDGAIVAMHGALQDITARRKAALETEQLAGRLTATMESITDALFTLDGQWRFTYVNARAEQLLERDRGSLLGRNVWDEFPEAVGTQLDDAYRRAAAEQATVTVEDFFYEPLDLWLEARAYPSADGLTVYFRDVGERHEAEAEREALLDAEQQALTQARQAQLTISHQATHDALTGLYNRNVILQRLESAGPAGHTVLLLDLDGFKEVNDALGHVAGNALLMKVAALLQHLVRRNDVLARIGGDEFVILLPGHEPQIAEKIAQRILETLRTPLEIASQRLYVTASIGISRAYPAHGGEAALRDADVALYQAKHAGRDRSVWYDPMAQQQTSERLATAAELHDALESDQLLLHYQPAFDLATGRPVGAEALARWQHPERGLISSGLFIPVAEETGLIEPLGAWCLAAAIQTAQARKRPDEQFTIWVNVAVHQLRRPGLAKNLDRLLADTRLEPHQFGIEITESAFATDAGPVLDELAAISALGVQIAIDDFGTGYSSLSRLAHLPIDVLKIDRSFITNLDTASGAATVAAIIDLAHAIDAKVIAEGVETPQQLLALRAAGCDQASGFLLARPDHPDRLTDGCLAGTQIIQAFT